MKVWKRIQQSLAGGHKIHVTVLDPAEQGSDKAREIAGRSASLGTDLFLVGGSPGVTSKALDENVKAIKNECDLPVVFFGRSKALSMQCDAILFMSILNSRNPDWRRHPWHGHGRRERRLRPSWRNHSRLQKRVA